MGNETVQVDFLKTVEIYIRRIVALERAVDMKNKEFKTIADDLENKYRKLAREHLELKGDYEYGEAVIKTLREQVLDYKAMAHDSKAFESAEDRLLFRFLRLMGPGQSDTGMFSRIHLIKSVRALSGMGLKESKEFTEKALGITVSSPRIKSTAEFMKENQVETKAASLEDDFDDGQFERNYQEYETITPKEEAADPIPFRTDIVVPPPIDKEVKEEVKEEEKVEVKEEEPLFPPSSRNCSCRAWHSISCNELYYSNKSEPITKSPEQPSSVAHELRCSCTQCVGDNCAKDEH